MTTKLRPLTDEELRQLLDYNAEFGPYWKRELEQRSWWRGLPAYSYKHDRDHYWALYGLRASHGPSWLEDFDLFKEADKRGL